MRSFGSLTLGFGVAAIAASGVWGAGCSSKKVTEIIPGATTQIQVPADIAAIRVDIRSNGALVTCQPYQANDGSLVLPATIGIVPKNDGAGGTTTITVEVRAYDNKGVNSPASDLNNCGSAIAVGQDGGPRVLRRSVQTFVDQRELFLPMPLSFSCFDVDCSSDSDSSDACKGGKCTASKVDSTTLADYNPTLLDGTGNCFDTSSCFGDAVSAVPLDTTKCLFQFPESQVPASGLNVRVFYQGAAWVYNAATSEYEQQVTPSSEQEILNEDADEGFTIPDSSNPQQFELAPGLCTLYQQATTPPPAPTTGTATKPYFTITDVQVASACASKSGLLPICAPQQKPVAVAADGGLSTSVSCGAPMTLVPAPSALYLVMDDSKVMDGAFGQTGSVTVLNQGFSNPVFKRTFVGFRFLDHCAGTSYKKPLLDFLPAAAAQTGIAHQLLQQSAPDNGAGSEVAPDGNAYLDLTAASDNTTGAYKELANFAKGLGEPLNVGAVMFLVNRMPTLAGSSGDAGSDAGGGGTCSAQTVFSGSECSTVTTDDATTLATAAKNAFNTDGLLTYYVVLGNDHADASTMTPPLCFYNQVATLAGQPNMVVDATQPITQGQDAIHNFAKTATGLGSCVYEIPPGVDTSATLQFTVPVPTPATNGHAPVAVTVTQNSGCTAASQGGSSPPDGWNIDGQHILICGASCTNLQNTIEAVAALAASIDAGATTSASFIPEVPVTATMTCQTTGNGH